MQTVGVGRGDRVAALLPNVPEAVVTMLAAASLGATFPSATRADPLAATRNTQRIDKSF